MQPIEKDEKTGILFRKWTAPAAQGALLLVHGLGAQSRRWECMADFFLEKNISSYAIDLKGFGETEGPRGHIGSFRTYFEDIKRLRDIISKQNPGKKVFILGESMGALISFIMAIRDPGLFDGLVCISPAFASRLKFTALEYVKILSALLYDPAKQFDMPFTPEMCTTDCDYQEMMDTDPREHRTGTSKLLFNIAMAQIRSMIFRGEITTSVLFLLAGNDVLVSPEASKSIFERLRTPDKTIIEYPEMCHALSIETGKERIFEDILKWVRKRI